MPRRAWIPVLAVVAFGGCGGEPSLSAGAADELRAQVAATREAASAGDRAGALEALDGMQRRVRELEADDALAQADADALRRGIGRARRGVRAEIAEPAPEPTATATATPFPTAAPAPPEPEAEPDKGKGKGKGNGNGKEKDEDEEGDD